MLLFQTSTNNDEADPLMRIHYGILTTFIVVGLCACNTSPNSFTEQSIEQLEEGHLEEEQLEESPMPENANKLGPRLKMGLLAEADTLDSVGTLNLLVQIDDSLSDTMRDQLDVLQAEVRTAAGDVLTVSLPADELLNLAALDFVVYAELSAPLSTDDQPQ